MRRNKDRSPLSQDGSAEKCRRNYGNSCVVGITGGVGAGKSTVLSDIKARFPVFLIEADEVGRELMEPGKSVFSALVAHYGKTILSGDGSIDRAKLAEIGLKDEESQRTLNAIEHPLIRDEILKRIAEIEALSKKDTDHVRVPVILLEAALLIEGGLTAICDEVWFVSAPKKIRIERLKKSRGYTDQKAGQIIARQLSYREFLKNADHVIHNGSDFSKTRAEIDRRMKEIYASLCDSEV